MKIELPKGAVELSGRDVILCRCSDTECGRYDLRFDENIGSMLCRYCSGAVTIATWGKVVALFLPEVEPTSGTEITRDMIAPADLVTAPEPPAMRELKDETDGNG